MTTTITTGKPAGSAQNDTDILGEDLTNSTDYGNNTLLLDPNDPPNGIYISEAGFIALLVILGILLLLVILVASVYVCLRMRKRKKEKKHEQKALELFMAQQRQQQPPKSSPSNFYSDILSASQKPEEGGSKFKSRTKTKTNGSLSPVIVQQPVPPTRRHSMSSVSSSSSTSLSPQIIGDVNQAYIGSPVSKRRKAKSKRSTPAPPPPPHQREIQLSPGRLVSNQGRDRRPLPPSTLRQMSWEQSMVKEYIFTSDGTKGLITETESS